MTHKYDKMIGKILIVVNGPWRNYLAQCIDVKEIDGHRFYVVNFNLDDTENNENEYVTIPEEDFMIPHTFVLRIKNSGNTIISHGINELYNSLGNTLDDILSKRHTALVDISYPNNYRGYDHEFLINDKSEVSKLLYCIKVTMDKLDLSDNVDYTRIDISSQ